MEISDGSLLTQLPTLADIDAEEDRQIIKRHQEVRDRAWARGENNEYPLEYVAALQRSANRMRKKLEAAREANGGKYDWTPEIAARMRAISQEGRTHVARLGRARQEWQAAHNETGESRRVGRTSCGSDCHGAEQ